MFKQLLSSSLILLMPTLAMAGSTQVKTVTTTTYHSQPTYVYPYPSNQTVVVRHTPPILPYAAGVATGILLKKNHHSHHHSHHKPPHHYKKPHRR